MQNKKQLIGALISVVGVLFGVALALLMKLILDEISLVSLLFYRFVFALPILIGVSLYVRGKSFLDISQKKTLGIRTIFGFAGLIFWILAIRSLPLGQATALFHSSALFLTLFSPFFLSEKVGIYRWSAVILGLFGVFVVTNPSVGPPSFGIVFGFLSALCGAFLSITLRRLGKSDHPTSVALIYNGVGALVMVACILVFPSKLDFPSGEVWVCLILLGVLVSITQVLLTTAYHLVDAVVVSSIGYLRVPLAASAAYILFSEKMTPSEIFGASLIMLSCFIIVQREAINQ